MRIPPSVSLLALLACGSLHCAGGEPPTKTKPSATAAATTAVATSSAAPDPASTSQALPPASAPALVQLADSGPYQVIDLHVDTAWKVHFKDRPLSLPKGHATPSMLAEGHYAAIVYPIYIPDYIHKWNPTIADADAIYDTLDKLIAAHEPLVAASAGPVAKDHVAAFIAIEGAGAFAADIEQIDRFIKRGVRLVGPVHAHNNKLASSATGKKDVGLTELGKAFCARVYAAGALVDVSHMSDRSIADLLPIAKAAGAPVVATHSNARALVNHPRNLSDAHLGAIRDSGGVAGLNLHRTFVRKGTPRMKHVVAQVMHMVKVAGVDHVAIGSDFDGGKPVPALANAGKMQKLAAALTEAGLKDEEIRKIFGRNALRILTWAPGDAD